MREGGHMRWLVVGAGGMLARDAVPLLRDRGNDVTALTHKELDITSAEATHDAAAGHDIVLNCAAWTAVDDAESQEADAFLVNAVGAANLARASAAAGARIVQISTDYVFEGSAGSPYQSGHELRPQSAYGRTKAAGEWAVRAEAPADSLIVRTAWLYGAGGGCFPKTIARLVEEKGALSVVDDQVGQPTWAWDVADLVERLVVAGAPSGAYHATAQGRASWFDFARAVCAAAGLAEGAISPTSTEAFPRPAPRPAFSVLGHDSVRRAGVEPIGDWQERWQVASQAVLGCG